MVILCSDHDTFFTINEPHVPRTASEYDAKGFFIL